jgi:ascorbate-specific PTS system EIIC-type component UlaA
VSLWDFGIGAAIGQAMSNEQKGENSSGCLLAFLYLPMMVELVGLALGLSYLLAILLEKANFSHTALMLVGCATFVVSGWIYILVMSLFERTQPMRVIGALLSGVIWTGVLWHLYPSLHKHLDGFIVSLAFFAAIAAMKGYSLGLFMSKEARAKADAKRKKPVSDGKLTLAVALLGPLGVLLKERNRD